MALTQQRNICEAVIWIMSYDFIHHTVLKLFHLPNYSQSFWSYAKRISSSFAESSFLPYLNGSVSSSHHQESLHCSLYRQICILCTWQFSYSSLCSCTHKLCKVPSHQKGYWPWPCLLIILHIANPSLSSSISPFQQGSTLIFENWWAFIPKKGILWPYQLLLYCTYFQSLK